MTKPKVGEIWEVLLAGCNYEIQGLVQLIGGFPFGGIIVQVIDSEDLSKLTEGQVLLHEHLIRRVQEAE